MAKSEPLVSIITAVYNPDPVLFAQCYESVMAQEYRNFEWIIVSDGCTDADLQMLDTTVKDNRVRVIRNPHGGVSKTRNTGLNKCTGDLITFLDADDTIEHEYLAESVAAIERTGADIAIGRVGYRRDAGLEYPKGRLDGAQRVLSGDELRMFLNFTVAGHPIKPHTWHEYFAVRPHSLVPRVYRSSVVRETRFLPEMTLGEDSLFGSRTITRSQKLVLVDSLWYWYTQHAGSATHINDALKIVEQMSGLGQYSKYASELQCDASDCGMRLASELSYRFARGADQLSFRDLRFCLSRIFALPIGRCLSEIDLDRYSLSKKQRALFWILKTRSAGLACLSFRIASLRR